MRKKGKIILGIILILVVAGVVYRFVSDTAETVAYETRPTVSVELPKIGDITLYTDLIGTIEPQSKASVIPKIGGEILEIFFKAGDMVEAGQALCRIDSDLLTSLKISMDKAAIAVSDSNNALVRTQALFASGGVSQEALEQAQTAVKNAQLSYEAAKNQYDLQLKYTTVTAPIGGIVESRNIEIHDHVNTGTEICVISAKDQLQVNFGVTEKTLKNISVNDNITIEKNGLDYQGSITEIGTMVNSSTGLYDVKAAMPETEGLTTGMRVKITVVMNRAAGVLTIPLDAVNYDDGNSFVYCVENGVANKTEFESGIYNSQVMEVQSGLTGDSMIITSWSNELIDGAEVLLEQDGNESDKETEN